MRYELDNNNYILNVFFGCYSGECAEYTGEIPEGYETLSLWAENANIRAYKLVDGNLVLDTVKNAELERIYAKETEENSCASKKYVNEQFKDINTIYDDELSNNIEGSSLFLINDAKSAEIVDLVVKPKEKITGNVKIKITNRNMLKNNALNKTVNGLTFEVNEDRSITINGTATADTEYAINGALDSTDILFFFKENKNYMQHGLSNGVKINLYSFDGTDRTLVSSIANGTIELSSIAYITYATLSIAKGSAFKDITVYPMITTGIYLNAINYEYIPCEENELLDIDLQEYVFEGVDTISIDRENYLFTKKICLYPSNDLFPNNDLIVTDHDVETIGTAKTQRTFENCTIVQCDRNVSINVRYFSYGYLNERFAQIAVEQDEISLEVSKKVGNDEIISKINQTAEDITIDASRININGTVSANGNFKIDTAGNMTCNNADITGGTIEVYGGNKDTNTYNIKVRGNTENEFFGVVPNGFFTNFSSTTYADILIGKTNTERNYASSDLSADEDIYIVNSAVGKNASGSGGFSSTSWFCKDDYTNVSATGITTPTLTQTSLAEQKKNFEKLEDNAIEVIKNIDIYKYNLKSENDTDKKHIGFVIGDGYNYSKEVTSLNNQGVDNYSFTSLCCKAIQEQQEIIEQLQKEIKELKEGK